MRFMRWLLSSLIGIARSRGDDLTVVGVVSPESASLAADVFTPIGQNTAPFMHLRQAHPGIRVWGRLRPDASFQDAGTELTLVASRLARAYPDSNAGRDFLVDPLRPNVGGVGSTSGSCLAQSGSFSSSSARTSRACCSPARYPASMNSPCGRRSEPAGCVWRDSV